jgi:hypothetical protein
VGGRQQYGFAPLQDFGANFAIMYIYQHRVFTSGTGTAYTSGAPEFTPDFCGFVLLNLEFLQYNDPKRRKGQETEEGHAIQ